MKQFIAQWEFALHRMSNEVKMGLLLQPPLQYMTRMTAHF